MRYAPEFLCVMVCKKPGSASGFKRCILHCMWHNVFIEWCDYAFRCLYHVTSNCNAAGLTPAIQYCYLCKMINSSRKSQMHTALPVWGSLYTAGFSG